MAKPKKPSTPAIKKINPSKYIELNPTLNAKPRVNEGMKHIAVVSIGDFSPPSTADSRLVESVEKYARVVKGDPIVFITSQDVSEGYIGDDARYTMARKAFGESVQRSAVTNIVDAVRSLDGAYRNLVVIAPTAVAESYDQSLSNLNNRDFRFESIEIISYADPAAHTDIIDYVIENDFAAFKANLAPKLRHMAEDIFTESLSTMLDEDYIEERIHPLSYSQRIKKAQTMKRFATRIEIARERAQQRRATPDKIRQRAHKKALNIIRAKVLRDRQYADLSPIEKNTVDTRLMFIPQAAIDRIAQKMIPIVRKAENERMSHRGSSKKATRTNEQFESFVDEINEDLNDVLDIFEELDATNLDRARRSIRREKNQDNLKHHRMRIAAKRADLNKEASKKFSELSNDSVKTESNDAVKKIIDRELERKKLIAAVKEYSSIKGIDTLSKKERETHARKFASKSGLVIYDFHDIIDTHDKTANAKRRHKQYNTFDASESVDVSHDKPSDREWGTDSLTNTYKDDTPGQ